MSLFLEKSLSHLSTRLSNQKFSLRKNSGDFDAAVKSMGDSQVSLNATVLKHIDAIMFGFWDGFFSGLITDFNEANKSPTCAKGRKVVANRMKVLAKLSALLDGPQKSEVVAQNTPEGTGSPFRHIFQVAVFSCRRLL